MIKCVDVMLRHDCSSNHFLTCTAVGERVVEEALCCICPPKRHSGKSRGIHVVLRLNIGV